MMSRRVDERAAYTVVREYRVSRLTHTLCRSAQLREVVTKTTKFAHLLHDAFLPEPPPILAEVAARTLGRLVLQGGTMIADVVDKEVRTPFCHTNAHLEGRMNVKMLGYRIGGKRVRAGRLQEGILPYRMREG